MMKATLSAQRVLIFSDRYHSSDAEAALDLRPGSFTNLVQDVGWFLAERKVRFDEGVLDDPSRKSPESAASTRSTHDGIRRRNLAAHSAPCFCQGHEIGRRRLLPFCIVDVPEHRCVRWRLFSKLALEAQDELATQGIAGHPFRIPELASAELSEPVARESG
jgi:hypothetical protein